MRSTARACLGELGCILSLKQHRTAYWQVHDYLDLAKKWSRLTPMLTVSWKALLVGMS